MSHCLCPDQGVCLTDYLLKIFIPPPVTCSLNTFVILHWTSYVLLCPLKHTQRTRNEHDFTLSYIIQTTSRWVSERYYLFICTNHNRCSDAGYLVNFEYYYMYTYTYIERCGSAGLKKWPQYSLMLLHIRATRIKMSLTEDCEITKFINFSSSCYCLQEKGFNEL